MATLILDGQESMLTTTEAANLYGVRQATIRKWQERDYLQPRGRDAHGRNLYNIIDLARAEKATREKARRT